MAVVLRDSEYRRIINKLIKARKALGLKQIDVAKKIGTYQESISRIETFATQLDLLQFKKLVSLYKKKYSDFLD